MAEGFRPNKPQKHELPSLRDVSKEAPHWKTYYQEQSSLDLSYLNLDGITLHHNLETLKDEEEKKLHFLFLQHNRLDFLPGNIDTFSHLEHLDLSNNLLSELSGAILQLGQLRILIARNNRLWDESLPKKLCTLTNLEELNLSGNSFRTVPPEIIDVKTLKSLYLGSNLLEELPGDIWKLEKLEMLYIGGNQLKEIPAEVGRLHQLRSLILCENELQSLPSTVSCLRRLRSLSLHRNKLTVLPPEIVTLKGLVELSLRDNPLVVRFVQDMIYDPPSLRELSARTVKLFKVPFKDKDLPSSLIQYLRSACRCVNPKCKGVYFDLRVEHIKFVDFCGKYRLPLLQYLCSPRCSANSSLNQSDTNSSDDDGDVSHSRLRRVLLG